MTALEKRLLGIAFGGLLALALPLLGDDLAALLLWPCLIAGAVLQNRLPTHGASTSGSVTPTSAHSHSDSGCSDSWDWDLGDCA